MLNIKDATKNLEIKEIEEYYKSNIKKGFNKIGLEWEKLSLYKDTLKSAKYEDLKNIIEDFANINGWGILKDEGVVIGAYDGFNSVSLEPGGQFELSLAPYSNIEDIIRNANIIWKKLDDIAKRYGVFFKAVGVHPASSYEEISIVPKKRYEIMDNYFKNYGGSTYPMMMRETAGVQINIDYNSTDDAFKKIKLASFIMPFMCGFLANSSIRNNENTGYKSYRAKIWQDVDKRRCGFFYKKIFKDNVLDFTHYIDSVIDLPMMFIERNGEKVVIEDYMTFRDFMEFGYKGYSATLQDYILHSSLYFPDVRLKNCIEIRNHDSQEKDMTYAICAFYKGIFYSSKIMDRAYELLDMDYEELTNLNNKVPKCGLDIEFRGKSGFEILRELFIMALDGLEVQNEKALLLEPIRILDEEK